jgi:hypothetical protein
MGGKEMTRPADIVPSLLDFFDQKRLSNIFMIDSQSLHENNAFNEQK